MATLASKDTSGIFLAGSGEAELPQRRTRSSKVFAVTREEWLARFADSFRAREIEVQRQCYLAERGSEEGFEPYLEAVETSLRAVAERPHYRMGGQIGPIHYRLDPFSETEELKEIDLDVTLTPGQPWDAEVTANGYQLQFFQSAVYGGRTFRYVVRFWRAGRWYAMAPIALFWQNAAGEREVISGIVGGIVPTVDNDAYQVTWANAFGDGIHFRYNLRPDEFFKTVVIQQKSALPLPTIGTSGLHLVVAMAVAWQHTARSDNGFADSMATDLSDEYASAPEEELVDPDPFAFEEAEPTRRPVWWLRRPRAWDSAGEPHSVAVEWRLQRRGGGVIALFGVAATSLNNPATVYPVFLDTAIAEERVPASSDDARNYGTSSPGDGNFDSVSTANTIGHSSGYYFMLGLRFTTVPLPRGATINSAAIGLECSGAGANTPVYLRLACENVDSASTFTQTTHEPYDSYLARTPYADSWDAGTWTTGQWVAGNCPSTVQELVNRAGWASGNSLVVVVYCTDSGSSYHNVYAYDQGTAHAPKLNCTYTEPASGWVMVIRPDD